MELIKVTEQAIGQQVVKSISARDLHAFLDSKQQFSNWIQNQIDAYSFTQDVDFVVINNFIKDGTGFGGKRKVTDYIITLDVAKELAMVERNAKGKQARQYFIECERIAKEVSVPALPTTYLDALKALVASEETKAQLLLESAAKDALIEQQKPSVEFVENYVDSTWLMGIRDTGKVLGIPQNMFVNILLDKEILFQSRGDLVPYSEWQKKGYMVVKTNTYNDVMTKRTFFTPTGVTWLSNLLG